MRFLFTVLIFCLPAVLFAQQHEASKTGTAVSGIVKDSASDFGLQAVTITIYKKSDSTLLDYQLTNEQGEFNFETIPVGTPVIVNFSFTGYNPYSKDISIDSASKKYDFKNVLLSRRYGDLEEVVVQAVLPIRMNGDTLEINPAAFKLDSNAVVEDMLRKVPGVTMWGDGSITVNGKPVTKVFVDGKPFFGGDPTIATQNLPKNAIDKIQVYQEIDYTVDNVDENPNDSLLTMNIKLREDKKMGFFGKAGAGIGTDDRYEADLTAQAYNKKTRLGLMGVTNNINKSADMQSIIQQSTYRNFNPSNRYVANFGGSGVNRIILGGMSLQHNFLEEQNNRLNNQLNASYNIRNNVNDVSSQTNSEESGTGIVFLRNTDRVSHSESLNHSASTGYNKRDRNSDFSVNASFNSSQSESASNTMGTVEVEGEGLRSTNDQSSTSRNSNQGINLSTGYRKNDDDERNLKSFNVNYSLSYSQGESERNTITDFKDLVDESKSRLNNTLNDNSSSDFSNSFGVGYNALKRLLFGNHNFWDINIGVSNDITVSKSSFDNNSQRYDPVTETYIENDFLTYNNNLTRIEDRPSLRFSRNFRKNLSDRFFRYLNLSVNLSGQLISEQNRSDIGERNFGRDFGFFLPGFNVNYAYHKFRKYNITANLSQNNSAGIPGLDQMYPINDTTENIYNRYYGNPDLKPFYNNNISFNFNYEKQGNRDKSELNFRVFFNAGRTKNGITDSIRYYDNGRRDIYYLNIGTGRQNFNTGVNVNTSFKLKKDILQFNYSGNYSKNRTPAFIDSTFSVSRNNNINNTLRIFYSVGDILTFQVAQGLSFVNNVPTGINVRPSKSNTYNTNAGINVKYPKDFTFSNTLEYVNNSRTDKSSVLWNAFVVYRFLKTKSAEVKFSAMDILRQNQNISVNTGQNGRLLSTTVTNGLQQFYMVTLSYYPRRFGGRAVSSRGDRGSRTEERPRNVERRSSDSGSSRGDRPRRN